jgi:hypothetical protein
MYRASGRVLFSLLFLLTVAACGGTVSRSAPAGSNVPATSVRAAGAPYSFPWLQVVGAKNATTVDLTVDGVEANLAPSDPCFQHWGTAARETATLVTITVTLKPAPSKKCITGNKHLIVPLEQALGSRPIVNAVTKTKYVRGPGGGYYEDTGNFAPPAKAACTAESYDSAVMHEIDGGISTQNEKCDGQFLTLDLVKRACSPGSEGCVEDPIIGHAFFVNWHGGWRLLTYYRHATCAAVARDLGVRFPPDVC